MGAGGLAGFRRNREEQLQEQPELPVLDGLLQRELAGSSPGEFTFDGVAVPTSLLDEVEASNPRVGKTATSLLEIAPILQVADEVEASNPRVGKTATSLLEIAPILQVADEVEASNPRVGKVEEDDDCVILDGDPHRPVAVVGAKGRSAGGGASDDEVEIVAVKGEIACKDFPHSRHLCSDLPFSTTSHVKHCKMCYCFVCDAPAPCKYWSKGLLNEDHCHATEKETKWKTLRQAFKCKTLPAPYPEKHRNVVYPTTPSPRQQEYYEEYRGEDEGEYFEPDNEATVCVSNLPYHINSEDLAELFEATVCELVRLVSVTMATAAASPRGARAEETPSPCRSVQSSSFKLYVGNLPWEVDGSVLKQLFSEYGEVVHAKVVYYHGLGARRRSRGFGFVTMATQEGSEDAIWDLDKQVWRGRKLRVRVAREEGSR